MTIDWPELNKKINPRNSICSRLYLAPLLALILVVQSSFLFAGEPPSTVSPADVANCTNALKVPDYEINIWRYYGQPADFSSVSHANVKWQAEAQSYVANYMGQADPQSQYRAVGRKAVTNYDASYQWLVNPLIAEMKSIGEGDSIFERIQYYSLSIMEQINYVAPDDRKKYVNGSYALSPNQVTLFEATELKSKQEIRAEFGKIPKGARLDSSMNAWRDYNNLFDHSLIQDCGIGEKKPRCRQPKPQGPWYQVKVGVSWLLSGQDAQKPMRLALEDDALETPIDRNQYRFVWEVGRAGQSKTGGFDETLKASAYMAYWELLSLGGDLDQAYVFGHSLGPLHTRLYRTKFGMSKFSTYRGRPQEQTLVAPLRDFLKLYPLETYSPQVAQIVNASNGQITGIQAMEYIFKSRQMYNLSLVHPQSGALTLRDFSFLPHYLKDQKINSFTQDLNFEPTFYDRDSLADAASKPVGFNALPVRGTPQEDAPGHTSQRRFKRLRDFLYENHAVEVDIQKSSQTIQSSLIDIYMYYLAQLEKNGVTQPHLALPKLNLRFCVTAGQGHRLAELKKLQPISTWFIHRDEYVTIQMGVARPFATAIHLESNCFSAGQISEWLKSSPQQHSSLTAVPQTEEFLKSPQQFAP